MFDMTVMKRLFHADFGFKIVNGFTAIHGFIAIQCNLMVTFWDARWEELIRFQRWAVLTARPPQRQGKAKADKESTQWQRLTVKVAGILLILQMRHKLSLLTQQAVPVQTFKEDVLLHLLDADGSKPFQRIVLKKTEN